MQRPRDRPFISVVHTRSSGLMRGECFENPDAVVKKFLALLRKN